jgi:phosphoribosyl 1,2-cyclic phosphodiesterase
MMKTKDDVLEARFWGVRGSLPSPGPDTLTVGGNTACLEITGGGTRVILDAGSGLRALGDALMASGQHREVTLLLSHVHWDHVMGLPFFTPLYVPGTRIRIMAGPLGSSLGCTLSDVLAKQMMQPMFPVDFASVGADVSTHEVPRRGSFDVGALHIDTAELVHPDPVTAYRVSFGGRSVVYATDTEHREGAVDPTLVALARGADVLIYDAQYTPEEYRGESGPPRRGWGHSTYEAGVAVARAAGVKTLALFHHDPRRTDDGVADIVQRARAIFPDTVAAREGVSIRLEAQPERATPSGRGAHSMQ